MSTPLVGVTARWMIARLAKTLLPPHWRGLPGRLEEQQAALRRLTAHVLRHQYPEVACPSPARSPINRHELQVYSQNGEDGILLYLFSTIGATNRRFVEIGAGNGGECNTANLSRHFGWTGLLVDRMPERVTAARALYADVPGVEVTEALVTAENVNVLLAPMAGELDLLSIDIDGNDYWVWKALTVVRPRVAIIEYNASLGDARAITVRYAPEFRRFDAHPSGYYHGASLAALAALGHARGYVLVGCDSAGVNAFFVRADLAAARAPALTPGEAYYPHARRCRLRPTEAQFDLIANCDFDTVK